MVGKEKASLPAIFQMIRNSAYPRGAWVAALASAALFVIGATVCDAASRPSPAEDSKLVALAAGAFPDLTAAERALLKFADRSNINRGDFATAGNSADPLDPNNDPAHADEWPHDRDIRAGLIRWLAVDNVANTLVDPAGVRVLGARIVGPINLSHLHIPFVLKLVRCAIPEEMNLESADFPQLDLSGSRTSRVDALNLAVHGDLNMTAVKIDLPANVSRGPFESDMVNLMNAKIQGEANFSGAHFHYSEGGSAAFEKPLRIVLFLTGAEIDGDLNLNTGFESRGCTFIAENKIGSDLNCWGARFINPGGSALKADGDDIKRFVFLGPNPAFAPASASFESDGIVAFPSAHVGADFLVLYAVFGGKANESHGLLAQNLSVHDTMIWQEVTLANGGSLDLSGANLGSALLDEEKSWPMPGHLLLDGFTYHSFTQNSPSTPGWKSPVDARSRLRWLSLQPGYYPQTYRQLAKVLRERGDEAGATQVRIAGEDLRYSQYGTPGRVWGGFLRYTIGYGHRPMLTVMWSLVVVLLGWAVVRLAQTASVMRPTYPENAPAGSERRYERLYPLLYSLDVFLPFVNLHQEHYWWPDADASGSCRVLGIPLRFNGAVVLYYLWAQIIAGWLLSAIFLAGVTGLLKNE